jgi:hypothetical protein
LAAPETEFDPKFCQGMANRMSVSYHKYGQVSDGYPTKFSAIESLQQRINTYIETGNTEYLIDVANFAMIEFMHPSLTNAFFEGTDSDGSPGRTLTNGETSHDTNK